MNFNELKLREIIKETSDTYSFIFEPSEGLTWGAGQHAMFKLKDANLPEGEKDFRIFSIASSMEDGFIMATTRIEEKCSAYKKELLKMNVGDFILMANPLGNFNIHPEYKKSFIMAGGIGITPIRSILRHLQKDNVNNEITVLYSDDRGEFAYEDTFKDIIADMANLDFHFVSDRNEFTDKIEAYAKENQNEAEYLIAGSPGMNNFISGKLEALGIEKSNIKMDNFMGY